MRSAICPGAEFVPDGIRLHWDGQPHEHSYLGDRVRWAEVRDADPAARPPELRLHDGRTLFITAQQERDVAAAVDAAGVPVVHRPPIWSWLLEPFLDTDYGICRERVEQRLREAGFAAEEVHRIRRRVRLRMLALTALTWEWALYGQTDLLDAWLLFRVPRGPLSDRSYRRFRRWTDRIADRRRTRDP
jgi:hypothetical protein